MADVIQDIGVFSVKDELVFLDDTLYLGGEEVTIEHVQLEVTFHEQDLLPILDVSEPVTTLEHEEKTAVSLNEENFIPSEITSEEPNCVDSSYEPSREKTSPKKDSLNNYQNVYGSIHDVLPDEIKTENESEEKKIWSCDHCSKTFSSRKGVVIHMRSHTGERPYSCAVCSKSFIDSSTLLKHEVIHRATRPFSCVVCHRGFNQKVALQRHEATHAQQPLLTCRFCPKTFLVHSSLQAHENIHSRAKPFQCSFCPSRFHTPTLQKQHERVHTNERPYRCNFCLKAFKDGGTLFKHQVIHSQVKPYGCPLCSNGFTQKVAVQKHIKIHVQKSDSKQCPVCKITTVGLEQLCQHLETHVLENPRWSTKPKLKRKDKGNLEKKPLEANRVEYDLSDLTTLCDVAISTSAKFISGIEDNPTSKNVQCPFCQMQLLEDNTLNDHLKKEHLFCGTCNIKFENSATIEQHNCLTKKPLKKANISKSRTQSGESKPKLKSENKFSCEKCGKSFSSRNGFVIHQRSHTGERPYGCRWCEKAFGDSATRHKHERIHTNERPFKCLICSKAFNQRASLRAHEATHSRGLSCQHCPMTFPVMGLLRKHVEAKHSDVLEVTCPLCAAVCADSGVLHTHISKSHTAQGEPRACSLCDSGVFTLDSEYCDHLVWHGKQHVLDFYVNSKTRKQTKRKRIERKYSID